MRPLNVRARILTQGEMFLSEFCRVNHGVISQITEGDFGGDSNHGFFHITNTSRFVVLLQLRISLLSNNVSKFTNFHAELNINIETVKKTVSVLSNTKLVSLHSFHWAVELIFQLSSE